MSFVQRPSQHAASALGRALRASLLPAALCVLEVASAQSAVTKYGVVDVGIGYVRNGDTYSKQLLSGVASGSRLGFRGQEDMGDGLSANFVLEQGNATDTGTLTQGGLSSGRQAYVGLSSRQGWSISAGRQFSPITVSMISVDPFGWQYFGNTLGTGIGFHESLGEGPGTGGFQATGRVNNSVLGTFRTGHISFAAMVSAGDEDGRGSGRLLSGSASYSDGPLLVTAAFVRFRQYAGAIAATSEPRWQNQFLTGASYDFKVIKVSGGYYTFKPDNAGRTAGSPSGLDPRFVRSTTAWIGARIPIENSALLINLMRSRYGYSTIADGKGMSVGIAYEYLLSKRTTLYASYAQVRNNGTGLMPLYAAIPAIVPNAPGADLKGYASGVRHSF